MPNKYDTTGLIVDDKGNCPKLQATLHPQDPLLLPDDKAFKTTDGEAFERHYQNVRANLAKQFNPDVDVGDNIIPRLHDQARAKGQIEGIGYIADSGRILSGVRQCKEFLDSDAEQSRKGFDAYAKAEMASRSKREFGKVDERKLIAIRLAMGESVDITVTILAKTQKEVAAYRKKCAPNPLLAVFKKRKAGE